MKYLLTILCFIATINSYSQNGLSEENAKMYIDVFFEGFHKGDTIKMKSVMSENFRLQNVYVNTEGSHVTSYMKQEYFLKLVKERAVDQKWDERLLDFSINIDGNLAHVWNPYEFWIDGVFSHCGANSFTLVSTDDGWKILNLIDSRRVASCRE